VQPEETAIASQWHAKHVSMAMATHATIEELLEGVFSMWPVLRLYNEKLRAAIYQRVMAWKS
jgi:hypothetical protein